MSENQTPPTVKPAAPVAVDVDAAADESMGVVSTVRPSDPIVPPTDEDKPSTVEDLFRAGEEARKEAEAAAAAKEEPSETESEQEEEPKEETAPETPKEEPASQPEAPAHKEEPKPEVPESSKETGDTTLTDIAEHQDDDSDVDDENFNDLPTDLKINAILFGKLDEALDKIKKTYKTGKEFDKAQNDPTSILSKYMTTAMHGWPTGARNFLIDVLKRNNNVGDSLVRQADAEIPSIIDGKPAAIRKHGANLNGKEASMILQSCLGGLHRVCLLNSGFWVVLRAPGMDELSELFATIDAEGKEIGRSLGAHFALISDMYIKRKFIEMLIKKRIIVESNFRDIYEKDEFEKALSFHDYDALMHAMLSICTRKGLRMQMYCPVCGEESEETKMDISACKFINRNLMTDAMIAHWNMKRDAQGNRIIFSKDDLRRYVEKLPVETQVIKQTINNGITNVRVEMELAVPSFARYFRVGAKLITMLTQTINNISRGNQDKNELSKESLEIHGYQLIAPWIKTLRVYEEDDKEPVLVTEDTDIILDYLDGIVQDEVNTLNTIDVLNDFVAKTRMTYIGTFSLECPKCHAKPETNGLNFYPIDVHTVFFGQCFRLLRKG